MRLLTFVIAVFHSAIISFDVAAAPSAPLIEFLKGKFSNLTAQCVQKKESLECDFHLIQVIKESENPSWQKKSTQEYIIGTASLRGFKDLKQQEIDAICESYEERNRWYLTATWGSKNSLKEYNTKPLSEKYLLLSDSISSTIPSKKGDEATDLQNIATILKACSTNKGVDLATALKANPKSDIKPLLKEWCENFGQIELSEITKDSDRLFFSNMRESCSSDDQQKIYNTIISKKNDDEKKICIIQNEYFKITFKQSYGNPEQWTYTATSDKECGQEYAEFVKLGRDKSYANWQLKFGRGGPMCDLDEQLKTAQFFPLYGNNEDEGLGIDWRECSGMKNSTRWPINTNYFSERVFSPWSP